MSFFFRTSQFNRLFFFRRHIGIGSDGTSGLARRVAPQPEPARPTARYEAARPAERPVAFAPEPAPEPEIVMSAPEPEAELYYDEPTVAEEPRISAAPARPVNRIVDPLVDDVAEEPLFPESNYYEERRPPKQGGFFSRFGGGRQRYEHQASAPQPQARSTQGARPQLQPIETPQADDAEDLEIPSFLRRLAN